MHCYFSKNVKCWHIRIDLTFDSKSLIYSTSACPCNKWENMTFAIGKLNFVSYQFILGALPLRPKKPPQEASSTSKFRYIYSCIHDMC